MCRKPIEKLMCRNKEMSTEVLCLHIGVEVWVLEWSFSIALLPQEVRVFVSWRVLHPGTFVEYENLDWYVVSCVHLLNTFMPVNVLSVIFFFSFSDNFGVRASLRTPRIILGAESHRLLAGMPIRIFLFTWSELAVRLESLMLNL